MRRCRLKARAASRTAFISATAPSLAKRRDDVEIAAGGDDLSNWAAQRGDGFFLKPDAALLPVLGAVSAWANGQNYEPAAVNTFLQVADYYLVAHALAHGYTVVTHEIASASSKRIKIPNACIGLKVKFMTPYEMLRYEMQRHERARFILGPQP